jgi:lipoprotein-anchoring transpeptidase ErfK/SrfK
MADETSMALDALFASAPQVASSLSRRGFLHLASLGLLTAAVPAGALRAAPAETWQARVAYSYGVKVRREPHLQGEELETLGHDVLLNVHEVVVSEEPAHNRIWYRVGEAEYIHSGGLQPVATRFQMPLLSLPLNGALVEVSVPFTDMRTRPAFNASRTYRYYYSCTFWVGEITEAEDGKVWYRVDDDRTHLSHWGLAEHFRPIPEHEMAPIAPELEPERKRLEVDLARQWVLAYQDDTPVFMSRASTGLAMGNGESMTPRGRHKVFYKRPSRHMAAGDSASDGYDLPGVPWCSYFTTTGVAFHGTYWHNDFGRPRSHGCINLPSEAARWIHRWTMPVVPSGERLVQGTPGTRVVVS